MLSFTNGGENISKLIEVNKKIEEAITTGYKKIEDKFVDTFLKQDGETIEEAKARIKEEQEKLEEQNKARVEGSLKKLKILMTDMLNN